MSDFVNIEVIEWKSYPFVFTVETIWVHSFGMEDNEIYWKQRKSFVLRTGHEKDLKICENVASTYLMF